MSATLLRLGLWIVLIVVALYVLQQAFADAPFADYITMAMLQNALVLGGLLIIAGVIARVMEKGAKAVGKNRCAVCRVPIASGAIYCRAHLRSVLHSEEDKTHLTKVRKGS